jgi:aerobic-type carbon monoxide dehydrogenase small subunit (CoxS/CutS family)
MKLRVNGKHVAAHDPDQSVLEFLRDELGLTGTKYGCGEGQCGACTVLVDRSAVRSCITPLSAVAGREITTIEGLETDGKLHPVQQAFLDAGAMQCGYCTAGMILSCVSLLEHHPHADEAEARRALNGNICRCGTYPRILQALRSVSTGGRNA